MTGNEEENLEELMKKYGNPSRSEILEKESSESGKAGLGGLISDYPYIQDTLDLHQYTSAEALRALEYFITHSHHNRLMHVAVITGKGIHSENGKSVLRDIVEAKLLQLQKHGLVRGFKWEKKKDKSGSVDVFLN